jgi:serine/threonine-protein kinase
MSSRTAIGQVVDGKYELVELAGEGGMATVYKALARGAAGFSRTVAVKKLKRELRAIRNYIDMFVEEARVGSDLAHPNIVQVYDFCGDAEGSYYLVMEWVEGMDLGRFNKGFTEFGARTPWPMIASVGIGTLRGLGAAHERLKPDGTLAPVIHRDVSPHNILLGVNGVVKLTDFGLARARDRVFSLTAPGTVKGKLSYLSPEVTYGQPATPLSDLFAMGTVLWESLAGQRLFEGKTDLDVFKQIRNCEIKPLKPLRPDLPDDLIAIIDRSLLADPAKRFPSARTMAFELAEVLKRAQSSGDAQQALGNAVHEARLRLARKAAGGPPSPGDEQATWSFAIDVDPLVIAGRKPVPDVSAAQVTRPEGLRPGAGAAGPGPGAWQPSSPSPSSVDVEFSSADLSVEPLPLTTKKKP